MLPSISAQMEASILARGFDSHGRLAVEGKAFRVQSGELVGSLPQWPFDAVRQAPLPKFVHRRVQEYRWPVPKQFAVLRLHESPAAERDHAVALKRFASNRERAGFGQPKPGFASVPKNLGNGLPLARLDPGIQIHKIPVQPPGKFLTHACSCRKP